MEKKDMITFCEGFDALHSDNVENILRQLNDKIQESRARIHENRKSVEEFKLNYTKCIQQTAQCVEKITELKTVPETTETVKLIDAWTNEGNQLWFNITQNGEKTLKSIQITGHLLNDAQQILIEQLLNKWKHHQILAGYGDGNKKLSSNSQERNAQLKNALDLIQTKFNDLFECVLQTCGLLDIIRGCYSEAPYVDNFETEITRAIIRIQQKLIGSCFIIDEQPPQVIKKDTRFEASVRLLLTKYSDITTDRPKVTVSILSELQTRKQMGHLPRSNNEKDSGEIAMDDCILEMSPLQKHRCICTLRSMLLKKVKRTEKKTNESVMDEKFSLLFKSTVRINNIPVNVCVISLPITVAVHGTQEAEGWATITWDNSFFENNRMPFVVRNEVPWSQMEWALSMRFNHQAGCALTKDHLQHLCEKVFGSLPKEDRLISWTQFCKNPLPGREFSFFEWFYDATKLTRIHLSDQWNKGLIHGFISRSQTQQKLLMCPPGTFLLRFSDSKLGGISIAWVEKMPNGSPKVQHMEPFVQKDFDNPKQSIGDIVKELGDCTHLYPNIPNLSPIPKEEAFGEYFSKAVKPTNGYVPKQRVFTNRVTRSNNTSSASNIHSNIGSPSGSSLNSPPNWQSPHPSPSQFPLNFNSDDSQSTNTEIVYEPMDDDEINEFLAQLQPFWTPQ